VKQVRLEEIVPQLPDNLAERRAILARARAIVHAYWAELPDPGLAMALQVLVQISGRRGPALAALEELQRAVEAADLAA
jgi:hypothetical protein